jgi:hypothetical protein
MAELERARSVASRIVALVGRREQVEQEPGPATLLRRQTFTLLMRSYSEAQRGIGYVRWHAGDADRIVPTLYSGRPKRGRNGNADVEDDGSSQSPAAGSVPSGSPSSTAAAGNATATAAAATTGGASAPVGFPGASPLTR